MNKNIKNAHTEAEEIKSLNEATEIMDKKRLKIKLRELEDAYKRKDTAKLEVLAQDFAKIRDALGSERREVMEYNAEVLRLEREKIGTNILNEARLRNADAKVGIVKYKKVIEEAAGNNPAKEDYAYPVLKDKIIDRRNAALTAGSIATVGALIVGAALINKSCSKNKSSVIPSNGTSTTSTLIEDTLIITSTPSTTTNSTLTTVSTNKTDYSMETVGTLDYSTPTRETNENGYYDDGDGYAGYGEDPMVPTTYELRETTPYDEVMIIETPPTFVTETVSYETTTVETNIDGYKVDDQGQTEATTSYIEPDGTDELPVEPTIVTVNLNELSRGNNSKKLSLVKKSIIKKSLVNNYRGV